MKGWKKKNKRKKPCARYYILHKQAKQTSTPWLKNSSYFTESWKQKPKNLDQNKKGINEIHSFRNQVAKIANRWVYPNENTGRNEPEKYHPIAYTRTTLAKQVTYRNPVLQSKTK